MKVSYAGPFLFVLVASSENCPPTAPLTDIESSTVMHSFRHHYAWTILEANFSSCLCKVLNKNDDVAKKEMLQISILTFQQLLLTNLTVAASVFQRIIYPKHKIPTAVLVSGTLEDFSEVISLYQLHLKSLHPLVVHDKRILTIFAPRNKILPENVSSTMLSAPDVFQQDSFNFLYSRESRNWQELYVIKGVLPVVDSIEQNWSTSGMFRISRRRSNMRLVHFNIIIMHDHTFVTWVHFDAEGKPVKGSGAGYDFVKLLEAMFNFTYTPINGSDWTTMTDDGKLMGVGRQILDRDGDFNVDANQEIVAYRAVQMSFTQPLLSVRISVFVKRVTMASVKNIYFISFEARVWVALAATWVVLCICWWVISKVIERHCSGNISDKESEIKSNMTTWSFSLLCQQGWIIWPANASLQIIFFSALFLSFILYVVYSTCILSVFVADPQIFNRLQDIVKYGYDLIVEGHSVTSYQTCQDFASKYPNVRLRTLNISDSINILNTEKAALVSPPSDFYGAAATLNNNIDEQLLCSFASKVKLDLYENGGISFRKNDPLKTFFAHKFALMAQSGLNHRLRNEFLRRTVKVCLDPLPEAKSLQFHEVQTCIYAVVFGALISSAALLAEMFIFRNRHKKYRPSPTKSGC